MHQQTVITATMPLPSLPASPTLTNPDMILPYGDYDSTPSPPQGPMRPESPLGGWKSSGPGDMSFSIGPPRHVQMGIGPITPTTPIIYGNGTMLSDIGEVTEAESTPGRKPRQTHSRLAKGRDSPLRSSPTMGYVAAVKRSRIPNHHRSVSEESNSTVTSEVQPAEMFKDFDDGISVDDSNFQGDDEESVVDDNYEEELKVAQAKVITRKESRLIESEDMSTSAALSRRAEMILANAKKRLDNMEGNLTRARSSLYITPSSSMSSIHSSSPLSRSTPSPEVELRIVAGLGVPPAKHRQVHNISVSPGGTPGHLRILSENSIPSSLYSPLYAVRTPVAASPSPVRAETEIKDFGPAAYSTPPSRGSNHYVAPLEPLSEDEIAPTYDSDCGGIRASTADPYSNRSGDHRVLTRSTSSMQMRDLTDKMKDLKGKISTLRDRAREDNMKRRSLQSLRTPSPFTAAEQWYTSSPAYKGIGVHAGIAHNPWNGEPSVTESVDGGDEKIGEYGTKQASNHRGSEGPGTYRDVELDEEEDFKEQSRLVVPGRHAPLSTSEHSDNYDTAEEQEEEGAPYDGTGEEGGEDQYVDEFVDHDELDEYHSESDASMYHDSHALPISHEDREDAFDYEHFFLHSAMGTIGRRGSSGSLESFGSEDSVETTRGPEALVAVLDGDEASDDIVRGHVRNQKSVESVSTLASFATATEGRRSSEVPVIPEDEDIEDYAVKPISEPIPGDVSTKTVVTEKRSTFGKSTSTELPESYQSPSQSSRLSSGSLEESIGKPQRPSLSSFSSTGTTRSFPLVNKPRNSTDRASSIISEAIKLNRTSNDSLNGKEVSPVDMLAREDQILVERLVASLGKCVLGLQESGRASSEGRMWRRRLDAARRVLEGQEGAV